MCVCVCFRLAGVLNVGITLVDCGCASGTPSRASYGGIVVLSANLSILDFRVVFSPCAIAGHQILAWAQPGPVWRVGSPSRAASLAGQSLDSALPAGSFVSLGPKSMAEGRWPENANRGRLELELKLPFSQAADTFRRIGFQAQGYLPFMKPRR